MRGRVRLLGRFVKAVDLSSSIADPKGPMESQRALDPGPNSTSLSRLPNLLLHGLRDNSSAMKFQEARNQHQDVGTVQKALCKVPIPFKSVRVNAETFRRMSAVEEGSHLGKRARRALAK